MFFCFSGEDFSSPSLPNLAQGRAKVPLVISRLRTGCSFGLLNAPYGMRVLRPILPLLALLIPGMWRKHPGRRNVGAGTVLIFFARVPSLSKSLAEAKAPLFCLLSFSCYLVYFFAAALDCYVCCCYCCCCCCCCCWATVEIQS